MYYNFKKSKRFYENLDQLDDSHSNSDVSLNKGGFDSVNSSPSRPSRTSISQFLQFFNQEQNVKQQKKVRYQSSSLPEKKSKPIAIPSPKSNHSKPSKNFEFNMDDLFVDDLPNGNTISDLMVECTQTIGFETYIFYYPIEIGDYSINLWSKDQKYFSFSIFKNGKSLTDSHIREYLNNPSITTTSQLNNEEIKNLLEIFRYVWLESNSSSRSY